MFQYAGFALSAISFSFIKFISTTSFTTSKTYILLINLEDMQTCKFVCFTSNDPIILGYILRDEKPFCVKCYEETFAHICDECGKAIGIDSKDLSYKDKHWHEECK
jgi:hypothetical protein